MYPCANSSPPNAARWQRVAKNLALVLASVIVALVLTEILLRVVPIPGIKFHSFYYDDVTGARYYPNTKFTYRNDRGDYVVRKVNSWGYFDEGHALAKEPGTVRIGFFGDSFTQAVQVPIE